MLIELKIDYRSTLSVPLIKSNSILSPSFEQSGTMCLIKDGANSNTTGMI